MVRFSCEKALLQQAVSAVSRAVAAKSSIPALEGILLECEDGLRLSGYNMQTGIRTTVDAEVQEAGRIVLNARLFGEMIRRLPDDMVTVIQGKRHLLFEAGSTQLICRRLEGEFLDYKNAIPKNNPISVEVDNKVMIESLDRVSVVISEKLKSPVRCVFSRDRVFMSARTGNGEARDICPIRGDGQELEIGFNNRYLMDALRYAPAETVKMQLNTGISPCIITPVDDSDSFLYMVLPVRLKAQ